MYTHVRMCPDRNKTQEKVYTVEQEIFATFIFCILRDMTEFAKVYPANLLLSQYKRIIPARKSRN